MLNDQLQNLVNLWMKWDQCEKTRKEVEKLIQDQNYAALGSCMIGRLAFGTAGMRAAMGAGFNRLNDLTMIQTAQGMLRYMQATFSPELLLRQGISIGYDARHNSERFARLVANIFLRNSIKVHLFSKIVPTPFVSFAVVEFKCLAGAMITASHNPKCDNGFKILSPHDKGICQSINENLEPWPSSWQCDEEFLERCPLRSDPLEKVMDSYCAQALRFNLCQEINSKCPIKFTYTPVHGVGYFYTPELLRKFGFSDGNIVFVEDQVLPDPDFPTAPFPNPEEGVAVLVKEIMASMHDKAVKSSLQTADDNNSTVVLANDPDADRFQLAEKQKDGTWRIFTGNEMGGLLTWWVWHLWKQMHPTGKAENAYVINSVVSSRISASIAAKEGFKHEETLTGFKWMANRAHQLCQQGKTPLLCWEESIGYMPNVCFDKDGVLAACLFAEMAAFLNAKMGGSTFADHLNFLALSYGHHLSFNSYFISNDPSTTKRIFDTLRFSNNAEVPKYPKKCGSYAITYVRDLTIGYDSKEPGNKPVLPSSSSTEMITFGLEDGSQFTLRASGTEPKIKYYIEIIDKTGKNLSEAKEKLEVLKIHIVDDFLKPELNNLIRKL